MVYSSANLYLYNSRILVLLVCCRQSKARVKRAQHFWKSIVIKNMHLWRSRAVFLRFYRVSWAPGGRRRRASVMRCAPASGASNIQGSRSPASSIPRYGGHCSSVLLLVLHERKQTTICYTWTYNTLEHSQMLGLAILKIWFYITWNRRIHVPPTCRNCNEAERDPRHISSALIHRAACLLWSYSSFSCDFRAGGAKWNFEELYGDILVLTTWRDTRKPRRRIVHVARIAMPMHWAKWTCMHHE